MHRKYEIEKKNCVLCIMACTAWRETRKPEHECMKERQTFGAASFEIGVQYRTLYAPSCIFIVYSYKLYGGRLR